MGDDRPFIWQVARPLPEPRAPTVGAVVAPADASPYVQAAIQGEVARMRAATRGIRNATLNVCSFNLGQLVPTYLTEDAVHEALHPEAVATGLTEAETPKTIASGIKAGMKHPRAITELPGPPVLPVLQLDVSGEDVDVVALVDRTHPILNWPAVWADDRELDEWLVYPIIPARRIIALFSPPKLGKSLITLEIAQAISRGVRVLGHEPAKPHRCLYLDYENDPYGDVRPRLDAMGLAPEHLGELLYESFPNYPPLDTRAGGEELLLVAQTREAEVVFIDTIGRAVTGEENDNDTWLNWYRHTGQRLKAAGVTVVRLDHTGKDLTKGMRGGSAKYGDVDVAWSMTKVGDKFHLECVANRLPVPDRLMQVRRRVEPLTHELLIGDVPTLDRDECVRVLDDTEFPVGGPNTWGYDKAKDHLKENGYEGTFAKHVIEQAVAHRKKRIEPYTPDQRLPYKDD